MDIGVSSCVGQVLSRAGLGNVFPWMLLLSLRFPRGWCSLRVLLVGMAQLCVLCKQREKGWIYPVPLNGHVLSS